MKNSLMDKKRSKDYRQISGHIPVQQYREFKSACVFEEMTTSDALEEAIAAWLNNLGNKKNVKKE
jgi:hypothetical protein